MKNKMRKTKSSIMIFICLLHLFFATLNTKPLATVNGSLPIGENNLVIIQVLETNYTSSVVALERINQRNLGNAIMLTQNTIETDGWNLTEFENLVALANSYGKYIIVVPYNYTDWDGQATNSLFVTPSLYATWKVSYPYLYGVMFPEVYGHQVDHRGYNDNSTGTITNQMDADSEIFDNIMALYNITGFRSVGAQIFMQDNCLSYLTVKALNWSEFYIAKLFNSGNNEVMLGQARGMSSSFNISTWGVTVDLWGDLPNGTKACPLITAQEAQNALYESWYYGSKIFHIEQGSFNGSWLDGGIVGCGNILTYPNGSLTDYGIVIQSFYTFLDSNVALNKPNTQSNIAVMLGQSGYGGHGPDWGIGIMNNTAHVQAQGWFQHGLFNYFYPNISDGTIIQDAWTYVATSLSKHFTGLPYGLPNIVSIYATNETLNEYDVIFAFGWSYINSTIVENINSYINQGGIFVSFATFLNCNSSVPLGDLEDKASFNGNNLFNETFGTYIDTSGSIAYDGTRETVEYLENTTWYNWQGESYDVNTYTWQFPLRTILDENTKVIASYDGQSFSGSGDTATFNATIIEHKVGSGYSYLINAREDSLWMPNKPYGSVIGDFINNLCTSIRMPVLSMIYPDDLCWLHFQQTNLYAIIGHDNSSATYEEDFDLANTITIFTDLITGEHFTSDINGTVTLTLEANKIQFLFSHSPENYGIEITNMDAGNWLFAQEKYYIFRATYKDNDGSRDLDTVKMAFTDGLNWVNASYDADRDIYSLDFGSEVAILNAGTETFGTTTIIVNFQIYLKNTILDSQNLALWMWCNDTNGGIDGWEIIEADYFNIYNQGGINEFTFSGDAGRLVGGDIFDLYAYNNSWVEANITFRYIQHVKMLPHFEFTLLDINPSRLLFYDLLYYNDNTETWTTAIRLRIGWWNSSTNPRYTCFQVVWYNSIHAQIKVDYVYVFQYDLAYADINQTIQFWVDLWINQANASSVACGRINAYYYPILDSSNDWLRWFTGSTWGLYEVQKDAMCMSVITDDDGNTVYAQQMNLMTLYCRLQQGLITDANPIFKVYNYNVFDWTFGTKPLHGIQTPVFDETRMPQMEQGGFLGSIFSALQSLSNILNTVWFTFIWGYLQVLINGVDSIFAYFGYPGAFRNFIEFLGAFANWVGMSITNVVTIFGSIFTIIASTISITVTYFTQFLTSLSGFYDNLVWIWNSVYPYWGWIPGVLIQLLPLLFLFFSLWILSPLFGHRSLADGFQGVKGRIELTGGMVWKLAMFMWQIINFVIDTIYRLVEVIPVAE